MSLASKIECQPVSFWYSLRATWAYWYNIAVIGEKKRCRISNTPMKSQKFPKPSVGLRRDRLLNFSAASLNLLAKRQKAPVIFENIMLKIWIERYRHQWNNIKELIESSICHFTYFLSEIHCFVSTEEWRTTAGRVALRTSLETFLSERPESPGPSSALLSFQL